ncbi:SDR family NAD(P)-dependent oxidoreductase [Domibacillus sp.]|uniref:SDR family NAD(P)-dependent oxidoreductase n=1 Tax=Domibacillus sp. TaxID=1969783 RepID=UPI002811A4E1|nr:SDR family NAD(P)-dependent oxidoreductase [Domibacillus sp.]
MPGVWRRLFSFLYIDGASCSAGTLWWGNEKKQGINKKSPTKGAINIKTKKTAVTTGGASGIGKAAALRLAADGVLISLVDLNAERLSTEAEEIRLAGGEVLVFHEDITNEQGMACVMQKTAEEAGSIDCVFANGGILGTVSPIEHFTKENWAKTIENNVVGTFVAVKSDIPYMKERGESIVLTSSVSSSRQFAQEGFSAYSTSKTALCRFF